MINQEYLRIRQQAWNEGWHHWQRIAASRDYVVHTQTYGDLA